MRVCRWFFVCCLAIGVTAVSSAGDHDEALLKEVEAIGDAISKAMVEDDVDFMLGLYTEDAISLPNFGPGMEGMENFKSQHDEMTASGLKVTSFESQPTDAWACGDQVIEIGAFTISLKMPGVPDLIEDKGKYMTVYVRGADGKLKIKAEIWNTDMNPMEMGVGG